MTAAAVLAPVYRREPVPVRDEAPAGNRSFAQSTLITSPPTETCPDGTATQ